VKSRPAAARAGIIHQEKSMRKLAIVGACLAALLASGTYAQTVKGEADPSGAKALPSAPATKEEKAAAKQKRKAEGAAVAKTHAANGDAPEVATTKKVSAEQKKAAAIKRKADGTEARKQGSSVQ
jgi:hypothetical protein